MADSQVTINFRAKGGRALKTVIDQLHISMLRLEKKEKEAAAAKARLRRESELLQKRLGGLAMRTRNLAGTFSVLRSKLLLFSFGITMLVEPMRRFSEAAGDATEILNKATVVFGDNIDIVRAWANNMTDSIGRAESTLLRMTSSLQDLFFPMGFTRETATQLSTSLTELAIDVASFSNKVDDDVLNDFQSAIVGNHKSVRKYGVIITESMLKQEAFNLGLIKQSRELAENEKVQARISLIMKGSEDAMGDAERTAHEYTQTVVRFKESWVAAFEAIGRNLQPIMRLIMKLLDPQRVKAYVIAIGAITLAWGMVALATRKAKFELDKFFASATVKTGGLLLLVAALGELILFLTGLGKVAEEDANTLEDLRAQMEKNSEATEGFTGANNVLTDEILKSTKALNDQLEMLGATNEFEKMLIKASNNRIGGLENLTDREIAYIKILADHKEKINELNNELPKNISFLDKRTRKLAALNLEEQKVVKTNLINLEALIEGRREDVFLLENKLRTNRDAIKSTQDSIKKDKESERALHEKIKTELADREVLEARIEKLKELREKIKEQEGALTDLTDKQKLLIADIDATNEQLGISEEKVVELTAQYNELGRTVEKKVASQFKRDRWRRIANNVAQVTEPYRDLIDLGVDIKQVAAEIGDAFVSTFSKGGEEAFKFEGKLRDNKFAMMAFKEMAIEAGFEVGAALTQMGAEQANRQMDLIRRESEARKKALENDAKFQRKSQRQKDAILKAEDQRLAAELKSQFEKKQEMAKIGVIMDTAAAIMVAYKDERGAPITHILAAMAAAAGAIQLATINAQQPPKFALGGLVGGRPHSSGGTLIEAESGEFVMQRAAVDAVGVETMNAINRTGTAGGVNISFSGNVMSDDFIELEAIPKIRDAIRRGGSLGDFS